MLRHELEVFFNALRFFTRVPVPAWVGHSTELLNAAARYFPAVGWLVGAVGAAAFWTLGYVLPASLALLLSMTATILMTGAFHEDGFADSCDGFGGGWEKSQVLAIMKDSRIGSYGTVGMGLMLATKFAALHEMADGAVVLALLVAHPLSRFASTTLIAVLDYVRDDDSAKSKPLAHHLSGSSLACAALFGLLPLLLLDLGETLAVLGLALFTTWLAGRYFVRRIGGYTGDCLGATQQVTEVAIYIGLHVAWTAWTAWTAWNLS